jgi:methylated-DNA-[protein]-cysteine S-methyltransferase
MFEDDILQGRVVEGMGFNERVWAVCARVPAGKVTTYGAIARELGTKAYRAVGIALNRNPYAPRVPCHRVVGSDGSLTGFAYGVEKKREMLEGEGVRCAGGRVDLKVFGVGMEEDRAAEPTLWALAE